MPIETNVVICDDMLCNSEMVVKSMHMAYPMCVANGTMLQADADWEIKIQKHLVQYLLEAIEAAESREKEGEQDNVHMLP